MFRRPENAFGSQPNKKTPRSAKRIDNMRLSADIRRTGADPFDRKAQPSTLITPATLGPALMAMTAPIWQRPAGG